MPIRIEIGNYSAILQRPVLTGQEVNTRGLFRTYSCEGFEPAPSKKVLALLYATGATLKTVRGNQNLGQFKLKGKYGTRNFKLESDR